MQQPPPLLRERVKAIPSSSLLSCFHPLTPFLPRVLLFPSLGHLLLSINIHVPTHWSSPLFSQQSCSHPLGISSFLLTFLFQSLGDHLQAINMRVYIPWSSPSFHQHYCFHPWPPPSFPRHSCSHPMVTSSFTSTFLFPSLGYLLLSPNIPVAIPWSLPPLPQHLCSHPLVNASFTSAFLFPSLGHCLLYLSILVIIP